MTTKIVPVDPEHPEQDRLEAAAAVLRAGGLVAYPTETFYALGADALEAAAVEKVFSAKGRPGAMPLPVIVGDPGDLLRVAAQVPDGARALIAVFWPGPLTLVLPAAALPERLLGGGRTIGVRLSPHPVARGLARALGGPIVATSANRSGQPAPGSAGDVAGHLKDGVDLVLDGGRTHGGSPSTIVDLSVDPPRLVRAGPISSLAVEAALGRRLA
ncbi:MAG TPA: L-threonylcarbamoyladenylate synthase [Candidatus Polarisedimenticolia bacterium]|nr:L-threonylcarbamoyladenylate synthase [Candidatus Polarisedimenticolia bacterium]